MAKVMLALSTFRQSDRAVELALEKARDGSLLVVFVADANLARYLIGTDVGLYRQLEESCESEVLKEHKAAGEQKARAIASRAESLGIPARTHVEIGRFALVCLEVVRKERPDLIVTTRSRRPAWVRRFFGSPVDHLIREAGCPVVEA